MKFHPIADLFPLMEGAEFDELVADIKAHGQREQIITTEDGLILDGRNRYRACLAAGVEPVFGTREDDGKHADFVRSKNLFRRNLNQAQRAQIAVDIAAMVPHGGDRKTGSSGHDGRLISQPATQEQLADQAKVGERTIRRAVKVQKKGVPELAKAVRDGHVPGAVAAKVANLPKAKQRRLVEKGPEAVAAAVAPSKAAGEPCGKITDPGPHLYKLGTLSALIQNWQAADKATKDKFRQLINSQPGTKVVALPPAKVETAKPISGKDQFGRTRPALGSMLKANGPTGKFGKPSAKH
jgi:hypothetical protein